MEIYYGTCDTMISVSYICYKKLNKRGIIKIPVGDWPRSIYFSDPVPSVVKSIFIKQDEELVEYGDTKAIYIDTNINKVFYDAVPDYIESIYPDIDKKLEELQKSLTIKYGEFKDELPDQKMAMNYLTGNEKVLEIGGNIGRNSLIIASLLKERENTNFVTLESNAQFAEQLKENRDANNFKFSIEASALSKRKLIQQGWRTIVSDTLLDGYSPVNIISIDELHAKYSIQFDTLILDCEGAFYYILMDMPEILDGINLIIMQNDYDNYDHKLHIDKVLRKMNFRCVYSERGGEPANWCRCVDVFYQVWKRDT